MDPLSITASVLTLTEAVAKVYRFLKSVHYADTGYAGLCTELYNLSGHSQSIATALQNWQHHPMALAPIDEDVWKQSRNAIRDSQQAIDDLNVLIKRVGGPSRSNSIFRRGRIATEIHFHTREIVSFRDKIRMSNLALQTMLQVITVSLSLRNNDSQTRIIKELEQLNQYLDISTRAAADDSPLVELDKSDAHVAQNLKNLVRAAEDFHASAKTQANTICSGSQLHADAARDHGYASPIAQPTTTNSKRRHLEMFFRHARLPSRMNSRTPSGNFKFPSSPTQMDAPEVVIDEEAGLVVKSNLDSMLSGGFSKMAQKALREFDFAKAEKALEQALNRHKISAPDDAHHSRLRTQLAICSFLQGMGAKIEDTVVDLAEFPGTKRPVAHQLLYNLALSLLHDLEFEAAHKICSRLWESLSNPEFSAHLKKDDLLRLLVVSFRMTNKALDAEALEVQHPELLSHTNDTLPSILESVLSCEDLLVELFAVSDSTKVPRLFVHQLRDRAELVRKSPFEQQMQRSADPGRPASKSNDQKESNIHSSLRQTATTDVNSSHKASYAGRFSRLKTILHWQSIHDRVKSDASTASADDTNSQSDASYTTTRSQRMYRRAKTYLKRYNEAPLWQKLFPRQRRLLLRRCESDFATDENGNRILSWMRGADNNGKAQTVTSEEPQTLDDAEPRIGRHFSFEGMPSTPSRGLRHTPGMRLARSHFRPPYIHASYPRASRPWSPAHFLAEMSDTPLFEMMDTSRRVELEDTGSKALNISPKRDTFAGSGSIRSTSSMNNSNNVYEIAELEAFPCPKPLSPEEFRSCHSNDPGSPGRFNFVSDPLSPEIPASYPVPLSAERSDQLVSQTSLLPFLNEMKRDETMRKDVPILTAHPNPTSLRRVGLCLYPPPNSIFIRPPTDQSSAPTISPHKYVSTARSGSMKRHVKTILSVFESEDELQGPSHDSGYKSCCPMHNTDSEDDQTPQGAIMAIWSSLRLFSHTTRKLRKRNRTQSSQKLGRIRNIQAKLKSVVPDTRSETSVPVRNRVHRHGMVYEYLGPQAVAGPYTDYGEPAQYPGKPQGGVPMLPDNPENIRMPVELDSRQLQAVSYAY